MNGNHKILITLIISALFLISLGYSVGYVSGVDDARGFVKERLK